MPQLSRGRQTDRKSMSEGKRYRAVVFDLYGTLIDIHTDEGLPRLWKTMAEWYTSHGAAYGPKELREVYLSAVVEEAARARGEWTVKGKDVRYPEPEIGRVFAEPDKLRTLEEMVYPHVLEDLKAWKAAQHSPLLFVESAIALDKPQFDGLYDKVLLVTAPYELRVQRNPKAAERDALQTFDPARADLILENQGTKEELNIKIRQLICKLI